MATAQVTLPGGVSVRGHWHRQAVLRPLSGADEAFLLEEGAGMSPAARSSELLARCVESLGPAAPVDRRMVRALSVGDREALFLHLRRLTFGERITCVITCPEAACGAKMNLELAVGELLVPPYDVAAEWHETLVEDSTAQYRVTFRLPNGGDQEAAAPLAASSLEAAAALILRRSVRQVVELPSGATPEALPAAVKQALPARMSELDRQAEILLRVACPDCGVAFTVPFDAASYFQRELSTAVQGLYHEVHLLAFHYHWGEAEILGMHARKRRRYLDLLATELGTRGRG